MAETKNAPEGAAAARPAKTGEAAAAKGGPPAANGEAAAKTPKAQITKLDAVRRALAKLGQEALPSQIQPYIKKTFGVEMTTDHISTYKGDIARKAREAAEAARPAAARKPAAPQPAAAPKPQAPAAKAPAAAAAAKAAAAAPARTEGGAGGPVGGSILLEDVLTTKELLDRVGADKLRMLIDGLAK